jgi:hypothetical protein
MGGEQESATTPEEVQAKIGRRLDEVAKILAGALVAVAGVMTALGLGSELVFVALNNESWPIVVASLCAVLAIVCSIVALLIHPTRRGNVWETVVLILGVIFYMTALTVAIIGAAKAAGGNGRPTITNIKLDGRQSDLKLRFDVHADGVKTWRTIEVSVTYLRADMKPVVKHGDLYWSTLRPDDEGVVKQRIDMTISPPAQTTGLSIFAGPGSGDDACDMRAQLGPTCTTLLLP